MLSTGELSNLETIRNKQIKGNDLVDIKLININVQADPIDKMIAYLDAVKNPYCYKCGDTVVTVEYSDGGYPLEKILLDCLSRLRHK